MTAVGVKTLDALQLEVREYCEAKGWAGPGSPEVSLEDAQALLHSEVSEALEAWRSWRLEDATTESGKPEGVGSEFADVLIRILDDCDRFYRSLSADIHSLGFCGDSITELVADIGTRGRVPEPPTFGAACARLHTAIAWISDPTHPFSSFDNVFRLLAAYSHLYGVDLEAEYERKMAYNRTRPFRHGGKAL